MPFPEEALTPPPSPELWASNFVTGASAEVAAETARRLLAVPWIAFTSPADLPRYWQAEPRSTYVFLRGNTTQAPDFWRQMASRLTEPELLDCAGPHEAMITHPAELTEVLLRAAVR